MRSIVVHYQEIALKGNNRPWFVSRLARNLRRYEFPHRASTNDLLTVRHRLFQALVFCSLPLRTVP